MSESNSGLSAKEKFVGIDIGARYQWLDARFRDSALSHGEAELLHFGYIGVRWTSR